jgi:hypothetical protein
MKVDRTEHGEGFHSGKWSVWQRYGITYRVAVTHENRSYIVTISECPDDIRVILELAMFSRSQNPRSDLARPRQIG